MTSVSAADAGFSIGIVCGSSSGSSSSSSSGSASEKDNEARHDGESTALITALSCRAAGFADITVYTDDIDKHSKTSVELSPNASRILRTLKTLEPLREFCFEPQFVHQRSFRTGFQLSIQALGAMAEGRYNAPFLHIEDAALCNCLRSIAETRGIKIHNARLTALGQTDAEVKLTTRAIKANAAHSAAESARTHDVVIVAADPAEQLRSLVNAEPLTNTKTNYRHWQGQLPIADLPPGAFGPVITQWLGPAHHLAYHHLGDKLHISAITADPEISEHNSTSRPLSELPSQLPSQPLWSERLHQWHPSLHALLDATEGLIAAPVLQTTPPQRLAHGRILFLATSCHPLLPHLPQQTALGAEDAWVASRMLEQWEDEPAGGWVEYEKYRLPRAKRLAAEAKRRADYLCLEPPLSAWQRNLALTFSSRFLPELAMQKNDWLYGYDAVNGFE